MILHRRTGDGLTPVLLLLSAAILLGGVAGCLAECAWPADEAAEGFLESLARGTAAPDLGRELWVLLRWPVLALMVGRLPVPGAVTPALFLLRGFWLSYGLSAFAQLSWPAGWMSCLMLFGPACILSVPVFFLLGAEGILDKIDPVRPRRQLLAAVGSVPVLLVCALLDVYVIPNLLPVLLQTAVGK